MMGRQLTVEMTKADGETVRKMCLALAGLTDRPKLPKNYLGKIQILPSRQKILEVE